MTASPLHALAEICGVLPMFHDLGGQEHWTTDDTRRALLAAMGRAADSDADIQASLDAISAERAAHIVSPEYVVTAGHGASVPAARPCDWVLKDDAGQAVAEGFAESHVHLPALGVGVHHLEVASGNDKQTALIPSAPARTPTLASRIGRDRAWGVTAALYGLRSGRNLGLGDYADLADLAKILGSAGAGFLGINPIHSWGWSTTDIASPYSPSHRGFLNTFHIAPDRIPGLEDNAKADALVSRARGTIEQTKALVDYQAVKALKQPLLQDLFDLFKTDARGAALADFEAFRQLCGKELQHYAVFETLAAHHGENWLDWPDALKDPDAVPQDAFDPAETAFHAWLQWVATRQLDRISDTRSLPLGLYLDLAIGARRDGAEVWLGQDSVAKGVSLGAPPDHLSPEGQNWRLAAFAPSLSAANGYRNLRTVLRQTMRSAGILRIDHVLGLNRSFWIPDDGSPGAYVQQPFETLLALVGIEAHAADCIVVGEDLGLVPDGFRETLAARGIYGYSVLQYEKEADGTFRDPSHLRAHSLACFATHDTPTLKGFCIGRDIDWWRQLDWVDDDSASRLREERKSSVAQLVPEGVSAQTAIHRRLANAPAAMTSVQLDDVLGEEEAQNLPGTIDEHANWRRLCPVMLEDLPDVPALSETSELMAAAGRTGLHPEGEN